MIFDVNKTSGTVIPKLFRRKQFTVFVTDFTLITGHTFPHSVLMVLTSHSTYYHFSAYKNILPLQCTQLKTYFHFSAHN